MVKMRAYDLGELPFHLFGVLLHSHRPRVPKLGRFRSRAWANNFDGDVEPGGVVKIFV